MSTNILPWRQKRNGRWFSSTSGSGRTTAPPNTWVFLPSKRTFGKRRVEWSVKYLFTVGKRPDNSRVCKSSVEFITHSVLHSVSFAIMTSTIMTSFCPLSAGVGRTGTFLAVDALLENGRKTGQVNVFEYVRKMRECRMNMVQTEVR